jgi:hypothetical protein
MLLGLAGLMLVGMVIQWLTREVTLRFLGFFPVSFDRDDHPVVFWVTLAAEFALCCLFVYWWF